MKDFSKEMQMVLYTSDEGDVAVDAFIKDGSIWITQKSMAELFGIDKSGISRHLKNIFDTGELDEKVVVAKNAITTQHGAISGIEYDQAMAEFYKSDTFSKLCDVETGLYRESSAYIYDLYLNEKKNGQLIQEEI